MMLRNKLFEKTFLPLRTALAATLDKMRRFLKEPEPPSLSAISLLRNSGMVETEVYYSGMPAQLRNVIHLKRMYSYLLDHPRGGESVAKSFADMVLAMNSLAPVCLIRQVKLLEQYGWLWDGELVDTTRYPLVLNTENPVSEAQFFFGSFALMLDLPDETEALQREFGSYLAKSVGAS